MATVPHPEAGGNDDDRPGIMLVLTQQVPAGIALPDADRYWQVREGFLRELAHDERVHGLFNRWLADAGGPEPLHFAISGLDKLAETLGIPNRGALFQTLNLTNGGAVHQGKICIPAAEAATVNLLQRVLLTVDALHRRWQQQDLEPSAAAFTNDELHLPWRWLAGALIELFQLSLRQELFGVDVCKAGTLKPSPKPAPNLPSFQPIAGESASDALARLDAIRQELTRVIKAPEKRTTRKAPRGPGGPNDTAAFNYGRWFCLSRIRGISFRQLALRETGGDRTQIKHGIAVAERFLAFGDQLCTWDSQLGWREPASDSSA